LARLYYAQFGENSAKTPAITNEWDTHKYDPTYYKFNSYKPRRSLESCMNKIIRGKAFVLGDNIDTDQIIPAKFLSYNPSDPKERKYFGMYALDGVPKGQSGLPYGDRRFVAPNQFKSEYTIVIGGRNFGCGSSREHAPLALAEAGAACVVAEFYARIFFRNCVNGGYLVPFESTTRLVDQIKTGEELAIDMEKSTLTNVTQNRVYQLKPLGDVAPIIDAGGVFEYARQSGMIAK
jgi:3-isopropylmalate/(R)-2-methylmalate dehydratase small subunit